MIGERLEDLRRRLLDLSRRNRLLNLKGTGKTSLAVVDESPEEVWRLLVVEERALQFASREEAPPESRAAVAAAAVDAGAAPSSMTEALAGGPALPLAPAEAEGGAPSRHRDRWLQTALDGDALQARLVHLEREATSSLDEQGTNVLHLTLGLVEWTDGPADPTCRAPLVFVPVSLARRSIGSRHALRLFDDDVRANPCLVELLSQRFHVELPPLSDADGFDLGAWLARVRELLAPLPGFRLTPEIHLGLFSFAKLLMWRDLDPATWPEARRIDAHPIVRVLCGVPDPTFEPGPGMPDPATMDAVSKPSASWRILDADSSQQAAIVAVLHGTHAVIDGPPGTGKSQTIANLIAEALAAGQRVLFVAEKAAALDVVRRRLDAAGLGRFVLELHSRKAGKRAVLEGLRRSLEDPIAPAPPGASPPADPRELEEARERLVASRDALHEPWSALARSPFRGIARALDLADAPEAAVAIPEVEAWTRADLDAALERAASLDRALSRAGDPATHPWRGARLDALGVEARQRVAARHTALATALARWEAAARALADAMGTRPPALPVDAARLAEEAGVLATRAVLDPDAVLDARWDAIAGRLPAWLDAFEARAAERAAWATVFRPQAETEDWSDVLARRRAHGTSWLRLLRPSWWRDRRRLRAASTAGARPDAATEVHLLEALARSRARRAEVESSAGELAVPFGSLWQGLDATPVGAPRAHAESTLLARAIVARGGASLEAARRAATEPGRTALASVRAEAAAAEEAAQAAVAAWLEALAAPEADWFGGPWRERSFTDLRARQDGLPAALDRLVDHVDARRARAACDGPRLSPFLAWAESPEGRLVEGRRAAALERQFERVWVDRALATRPALSGFVGEDLAALRERFRRADVAWIEGTRSRLAALLASRRPAAEAGTSRDTRLGLVRAEMRRKRGHLPIRQLLERAGDVIQAVTPCFMMSPISVAQYVAPGALSFDLVVFDEASQVEPADAYGAIARGRQVVLVGDERQLPPTSFFRRMEAAGPAGEEASAGDLESVLALGLARLPERNRGSLRWHYRSRDDSLIAFSNRAFYDGRLVTFPAPRTGRLELGLSFRFVEGGVYRRAAGQDNPVEARAVAEAVMEHAAREGAKPPGRRLSLGVGAMSVAQQGAVEDAIERLRRAAPEGPAEPFFDPDAPEPFFVKNLETIQGDERDVIFLTVGYGRDEGGRMTQNFGPLNQDGGWRRLNVLVTRARARSVLFASIRARDVDVSATSARGVQALGAFLDHAERGATAVASAGDAVPADGVVVHLARALRARGYEVAQRVGAGASRVELAVVDPDDPTRYVLGIETDGESWRDTPTVCDRDRLRPEALERMGWELERVHAVDAWRRPAAVIDRLVARIEAMRARARADTGTVAPAAPPLAAVPTPAASVAPRASRAAEPSAPILPAGVRPYARTAPSRARRVDDLVSAPVARVADELVAIVLEEGPVHVDEALRVLAARHDTRATARPREAFERALERATADGRVVRREAFLWPRDLGRAPVRWRGEGSPVTDPALIAPEEWEEAVLGTLAAEFGGRPEAVVASTARRLGWARTGPAVRGAIEAALAALLARGAVRSDPGGDVVPGGAGPR